LLGAGEEGRKKKEKDLKKKKPGLGGHGCREQRPVKGVRKKLGERERGSGRMSKERVKRGGKGRVSTGGGLPTSYRGHGRANAGRKERGRARPSSGLERGGEETKRPKQLL